MLALVFTCRINKRIMLFKDITHKAIGCAMKVHGVLGNGFQELIYQKALAIEFGKQGLGFMREMEMIIYYEGIDMVPGVWISFWKTK